MKEIMTEDFDYLKIILASPEDIDGWSSGEVINSETINYRTQRSERGGLFDERIFGPEKNYECYCGKYKGIRYKGITCEKCGVEITKSIVRRRRMGHIELAAPVSHIWYLRAIPSRLSLILGIKMSDLEKVIYFTGYLITYVDEDKKKEFLSRLNVEFETKASSLDNEKDIDKLKILFGKIKKDLEVLHEGAVVDEPIHARLSRKFSKAFKSEIGAEAIYNLAKRTDMKQLLGELEEEFKTVSSIAKPKLIKRISIVKSMQKENIRPEWMFLKKLLVIPPALRPVVSLGAGRTASSDVNDLYRRVINRNRRLKKLIDIDAPDVILRNEKRILQEAVDALIDNNMRHNTASAAMSTAQRRPLKSLADSIKGKQGIFRANLLGKRVDYSGRSVIVVGPDLAMSECGLPKHMALELFRLFVASKLIENDHAHNVRTANRIIDNEEEIVWKYLEEVIEDKRVLLNRAPTLHKLGILAFKPILTEGMSIKLHPLVCSGFNADFDGDQMAVHLPIGIEAQKEAEEIMSATKNVLKPGNGSLTVSSKLDIVLGVFWATNEESGVKGENKFFASPNDAINAYDYGIVDLRAKIKVLGTSKKKYAEHDGKIFETTVGRLIFNGYLPNDFSFVNKRLDSELLSDLEEKLIEDYGLHGIADILDKIKDFGFKYATMSGTTFSNDDITVPKDKEKLIKEGEDRADKIFSYYNDGLISESERKRKLVEVWFDIKAQMDKKIGNSMKVGSSVSDMAISKARGSKGNFSTMAGMKGIVNNVLNEAIEFPVKSSAKEGLSPIEYFITTHGSRKGLADTALNTARAGYLTRRLFSVAQDVIITSNDCGTSDYIVITDKIYDYKLPISKNIKGRFLAEDLEDNDGNLIFKKGHFITIKDSNKIERLGINRVKVRSPLTCENEKGVCQKCYGMDMGKDTVVDLGEPVGTIAAQAIGEPGTQLTMRTFHSGGAATEQGDITQGLPRIEEIFDRRKPKIPAIISKTNGEVLSVTEKDNIKTITILTEDENVKVKEITYSIPYLRIPVVKKGDKVAKGQMLTEGSANIEDLLKYAGISQTQDYITAETVKIYELQGSSVSRKHMEVVIRQMFSREKIVDPGDSSYVEGDHIEKSKIKITNKEIVEKGGVPIKTSPAVLGITEVTLSSKSFLSAASFQYTVKVLIKASLRGDIDTLDNPKENVIIGRLIPAGSGFKGSKKYEMIAKVQEEQRKREDDKEMIEINEDI